jgi:uncharacterized iron-regulated membrane protein
MSLVTRFFRQPQSVWARRALFQIHLWTGIGVGLYIFAISVSGAAIVFRREIAMLLWERPTVTATGPIMTPDQLGAFIKKANPRFEIVDVKIDDPQRAAIVTMTRGQRRRARVFDPYTGKDLGDVAPGEPDFMSWLVSLHDDLLADRTGRAWNGVGAILLTLLCLTGVVIWWPGRTRWARSLFVKWRVGWPRFNWDLHSALGFWLFVMVFMWGISGIYLSFPGPVSEWLDYIQPADPNSTELRAVDEFTAWLARIHFGRAYGTTVKWIYTILGLVPAVLFVTGAIMWWNRVLRKALLHFGESPASVQPVPAVQPVPVLEAADTLEVAET